MKVCYTKFEVVFRNATLVFTDREPQFRNRLDVYNYVCANRLAGRRPGRACSGVRPLRRRGRRNLRGSPQDG